MNYFYFFTVDIDQKPLYLLEEKMLHLPQRRTMVPPPPKCNWICGLCKKKIENRWILNTVFKNRSNVEATKKVKNEERKATTS
jgi:hypothetical protein